MKKGLVVIYDPHALMQFLQFYCMQERNDIRWDVLCLPKDDGKQEMDSYCEKAGIFNKIYTSDIEFKQLSIINKLHLFIPMMIYALVKRQRAMCIKLFNRMVDNVESYDYYAANTESGFMTGLMASFAEEKTVIYFEDGSADYMIERKKNQSFFKKGSFMNFQCVLMAKLGYFGKGYTYFEPTKNCIKYASEPKELKYKNYKEIIKFQLNDSQVDLYKNILTQIYPELSEYGEVGTEAKLVFTVPLNKKNKYWTEYKKQFEQYISVNCSKVYLKKHPRDEEKYDFGNKVIVVEIPQNIPAELLFPYFKGCKCYMMEPDSLVINMDEYHFTLNILYGTEYEDEQGRLLNSWVGKDNFENLCERFIDTNYKIIEI